LTIAIALSPARLARRDDAPVGAAPGVNYKQHLVLHFSNCDVTAFPVSATAVLIFEPVGLEDSRSESEVEASPFEDTVALVVIPTRTRPLYGIR